MPSNYIQVVPLGNPNWLVTPDAEKFFNEVFASENVDGDSVRAGLKLELGNVNTKVLLGFVAGELKGMMIGFVNRSLLFQEGVTIYHYHNTGGVKLRNALILEFSSWMKDMNCDTAHVYNTTEAIDGVWKRALKRLGEVEEIGTVYGVKLKD